MLGVSGAMNEHCCVGQWQWHEYICGTYSLLDKMLVKEFNDDKDFKIIDRHDGSNIGGCLYF